MLALPEAPVLVVARSICSVLYGRVVHLLKGEAARVQRIPAVDVMHHLQACTEQLQRIEQRFTDFHQQQLFQLQNVETGFHTTVALVNRGIFPGIVPGPEKTSCISR